MTTVLQIIDRSLEHIGIKAPGETTSAEDSAVGLDSLQALLDSFQLNGSAVVGLQELTFTPVAGAQTVTIGLTGCDITSEVPASISRSSFYRVGGQDFPLVFFDSFEQYAAQTSKAATGLHGACFYARSPSAGTLYLWPASDGSYALHLWAGLEVVTNQATLVLADTPTLPYGYRQWIEYALAAELCPTFTRPKALAMMMEQRAQRALNVVKRGNFTSQQLGPRSEFLGGPRF